MGVLTSDEVEALAEIDTNAYVLGFRHSGVLVPVASDPEVVRAAERLGLDGEEVRAFLSGAAASDAGKACGTVRKLLASVNASEGGVVIARRLVSLVTQRPSATH